MRSITSFAFAAVAGLAMLATVPVAQAQISISIGTAPSCPYGYYDYAPYRCSPRGYYGPQYFNGGMFIGVGPWFHGPSQFHGSVDNRYDPRYGYRGAMPRVGERPVQHSTTTYVFHGNEDRDGRGHASNGNIGHGNNQNNNGHENNNDHGSSNNGHGNANGHDNGNGHDRH